VRSGSRVAGVACALAIVRVAALAGHTLVWSWWSPIAYLWQDAAVLLVYAAIDRASQRVRGLPSILYAGAVSYLALSVPIVRVMSTPMTWTLWRAAGGALSDSVWMYVTPTNLLWIAATLVTSMLVAAQDFSPAAAEREKFAGLTSGTGAVLLSLAVLGPTAASHVDTHGLDLNAWSALPVGLMPRVDAAASAIDWRIGRQHSAPIEDLTSLRGLAADRNVILVSLESTAARYLRLYGAADEDPTPVLSRLARTAVVFDNAYAVYPESIKGLFSTLCSAYPPIDVPTERFAATPCRSLAARLAVGGYRTALFHSGRFDYLGMDAVVRHRGYEMLADAGEIGGDRQSSFGVDDRATVARMLRWIDGVPRSRRFFATYLPISGHHPYDAPAGGPFPSDDEFGRYRNALRYGDAALGDLVDGLERRGLDRNTLWIVVGDHGEAFGQHDGNFGHTFQLYEENVHVPFVIATPGVQTGQTRVTRTVSLIDTAPTVLDLLGLPQEPTYQGRSALGPSAGTAYFLADYSLGLLGLRDGRLKCLLEIESGRARLFDVVSDPRETDDVAVDHSAEADWYVDRLRAWSAAQRARLDAR